MFIDYVVTVELLSLFKLRENAFLHVPAKDRLAIDDANVLHQSKAYRYVRQRALNSKLTDDFCLQIAELWQN